MNVTEMVCIVCPNGCRLKVSRDGDKIWQCGNCGFLYEGEKAPEKCPVCEHPQGYFEIKAENF